MTRRRKNDRNLSPKAKQMREQRERDAWMKELAPVREVMRRHLGL